MWYYSKLSLRLMKHQSYCYSNTQIFFASHQNPYCIFKHFFFLMAKERKEKRRRANPLTSWVCPFSSWRSPTERFKVGGCRKKLLAIIFIFYYYFRFKLLVYHVQRCGEALYLSFSSCADGNTALEMTWSVTKRVFCVVIFFLRKFKQLMDKKKYIYYNMNLYNWSLFI